CCGGAFLQDQDPALRHPAAGRVYHVIVVTRGGGSIAELACFDSKDMALAIAASKYPVITGIGHEINTSIADLAAHTFAKTPTAAAQLLAGRVIEFMRGMDERWHRLGESALEAINGRRVCLRDAAIDIQTMLPRWLKGRREQNIRFLERLKRSPGKVTADAAAGIERSGDELRKTIRLRLTASVAKIGNYQKLADMASPKNILKRGFSITRSLDGRAVRSSAGVRQGQTLRTELSDGYVDSSVMACMAAEEKKDA
ncbi:MAG: exodeoxyribonuclease VII large subunit, partial [Candidatus Omnitrophota bacterium]